MEKRESEISGLFCRHPLYKKKPKVLYDAPKVGYLDEMMFAEYQKKYGLGRD